MGTRTPDPTTCPGRRFPGLTSRSPCQCPACSATGRRRGIRPVRLDRPFHRGTTRCPSRWRPAACRPGRAEWRRPGGAGRAGHGDAARGYRGSRARVFCGLHSAGGASGTGQALRQAQGERSCSGHTGQTSTRRATSRSSLRSTAMAKSNASMRMAQSRSCGWK